MSAITHAGDAVKWARKFAKSGRPLFHALLCDAPYEMDFMGQEWDGSGVAFEPDTWEAFGSVLHPGGFLFVFAGTINDDLISVAMRKAGLRKFHKMMGWAYGSGFPKAQRVNYSKDSEWLSAFVDIPEIFSGHRYGLQAIKPAIETILVFQKPYEGKAIDNITETGAGALNIAEARIPHNEPYKTTKRKFTSGQHQRQTNDGRDMDKWEASHLGGDRELPAAADPSGRWPSNLLLLDETAARALDDQSGETKSGLPNPTIRRGGVSTNFAMTVGNTTGYGDSGGASRFFFQVSEQIDEADPVFYSAKASRKERDAGLEDILAQDSVVQNTSGRRFDPICNNSKKRIQDCKCGSCEWDKSTNPKVRNPHPTVKPLSLTKYLAGLLLPPALYAPRRLFVPFAGVGSEQIGAVMAGWEEVEGVEITKEYIPINRARLKYWEGRDLPQKKASRNKAEETQEASEEIRLPVSSPRQMELI